jgi:hypothetical protein
LSDSSGAQRMCSAKRGAGVRRGASGIPVVSMMLTLYLLNRTDLGHSAANSFGSGSPSRLAKSRRPLTPRSVGSPGPLAACPTHSLDLTAPSVRCSCARGHEPKMPHGSGGRQAVESSSPSLYFRAGRYASMNAARFACSGRSILFLRFSSRECRGPRAPGGFPR